MVKNIIIAVLSILLLMSMVFGFRQYIQAEANKREAEEQREKSIRIQEIAEEQREIAIQERNAADSARRFAESQRIEALRQQSIALKQEKYLQQELDKCRGSNR